VAETYQLNLGGRDHQVVVERDENGLSVLIDGERLHADLERVDGPLYSLLLDGQSYEVVAQERTDGVDVVLGDRTYEVEYVRPGRAGRAAARADGELQLKAPMTGTVVATPVAAGATVAKGEVVVVVESMKMNNEIRAPRDGVVREVRVKPGDRVERNSVLATIA